MDRSVGLNKGRGWFLRGSSHLPLASMFSFRLNQTAVGFIMLVAYFNRSQ
jgi:hypothetical protein